MESSPSILEQLGINSTFFTMGVVFLAVYLLNWLLALKPLSAYLVERDKRMAGRDAEINAISSELDSISEELKAQMKVAQAEAAKTFSGLKIKATDEQREKLAQARAKAGQGMSKLRDELEQELEVAKEKLMPETKRHAEQILEQLAIGIKDTKGSSKNGPRTEA